jgi:hypothetical protein
MSDDSCKAASERPYVDPAVQGMALPVIAALHKIGLRRPKSSEFCALHNK